MLQRHPTTDGPHLPPGGDPLGLLSGPPHPALPGTLSPTPTLQGILEALRRRWLLAAVLGVLTAGVTAVAAWKLVPEAKYQVRAMVHLAAVPETILGRASGDSETHFAYFQKTQVTLVKSQVVLDAVVTNRELVQLPVLRGQASPKDWLFSKIEADFKQGPEVLSITMRGDEVEDFVALVNAVMKAYLAEFINLEEKRRTARLAKLTELQAKHQAELAQKKQRLGALAPRMGGGHPGMMPGLLDGILKQIAAANEELQTVQADLSRTVLAVQRVENQLTIARTKPATPDASLIDQELNQDPTCKALLTDINELEATITKTRLAASTADIADKALRASRVPERLADRKQALAARRKEIRGEAITRIQARKVTDLEADLEKRQENLAYLRAREPQLLAMLADLAQQSREKGEEAFRLGVLVREVEEEEKILTAIVNEVRTLRLDMVAPPRVKPLDEAVVTPNVGKKRLLAALGGAAGVLACSLLGVGLWEFRQRKIERVDEIIFGFGIGVVGTLPTLQRQRGPRPGGLSAYKGGTGYIDSFRTLLLHGGAGAKVRVLLITSAEPGEGKTSLACHLAVSLARSGRKTLLLDGDMRKPTAHRVFDLTCSPGLSEVLTDDLDLDNAVRPSGVAGLSILTAGEGHPVALERLVGQRVRDLFDRLKQQFDVIVIDSCPLLPVADSLHLAQCADGVVFSTLRRHSRLPKLSAAVHRIRLIDVPILGAVIHGTDEDVYSTGYYSPLIKAEH